MLFRLFLLFTLLPLVELVVLVWLTWETNWVVTLLTILVPGIVGAILVRWEGVRCLRMARHRVVRGQMPGEELLDAILILIAGVLLISPGVLSDMAALMLLLPPVRRFVRSRLSKKIRMRITKVVSAMVPPSNEPGPTGDGPIVDVESKPTRPRT